MPIAGTYGSDRATCYSSAEEGWLLLVTGPWPRRVSEREGQAKVLRAKVEQVEREKRELQTRIAQGSQGGMAAFQAQELQRQLDIARQNLAHKDQEVCCRLQIVLLFCNEDRSKQLAWVRADLDCSLQRR